MNTDEECSTTACTSDRVAGWSSKGTFSPASHRASTLSTAARKCSISGRGLVLPFTYWLIWLRPSLMPWVCAALTKSLCRMLRRSIAWLRRCANRSVTTAPLSCVQCNNNGDQYTTR
ncbi:hypothetical protein CQR51_1692 [Bifidobacterium pseudolongum subsp. globosum]|nr:hypothetical protein CQR51_1692 [Bifidobacterium pseudolongum subsp. globosum]